MGDDTGRQVAVFGEALRCPDPCVLLLGNVESWWNCAVPSLRDLLLSLLQAVPFDAPVLLAGYCSSMVSRIDDRLTHRQTNIRAYIETHK